MRRYYHVSFLNKESAVKWHRWLLRHLLAISPRPGAPYRSRLTTDVVPYKLNPLPGSTVSSIRSWIHFPALPCKAKYSNCLLGEWTVTACWLYRAELFPTITPPPPSPCPWAIPPANTRSRPMMAQHWPNIGWAFRLRRDPSVIKDTIGGIKFTLPFGYWRLFLQRKTDVFCREYQCTTLQRIQEVLRSFIFSPT